jgi:hypothetical protein
MERVQIPGDVGGVLTLTHSSSYGECGEAKDYGSDGPYWEGMLGSPGLLLRQTSMNSLRVAGAVPHISHSVPFVLLHTRSRLLDFHLQTNAATKISATSTAHATTPTFTSRVMLPPFSIHCHS